MLKIIVRLLRSPWVRRLLVWIGPMILGWLLDRVGKPKGKKSVRSSRV